MATERDYRCRGIACARGSDGHVLLGLGLWSVVGSGDFNIKVVR
jgi:hypothetical protein